MKIFLGLFRLASLVLMAMALFAHQAALGQEPKYTDSQFERVVQGYLLLGREQYAEAAAILHGIGVELGNEEILRDAAKAAVSSENVALAQKIGEDWLIVDSSGGALRLLTRIQATTKGLKSAIGLLSRIATESGPEEVYRTLQDLNGDIATAMRLAHPLHLRDSDFYAYLSILLIRTGNVATAFQAVEEGLRRYPESARLLIVRIQLAEIAQDDFGSINFANKLAKASNSDPATAIMVYQHWRREGELRNKFFLPHPDDFQSTADRFGDSALLEAGSYYLRHGDPEVAIEVLAKIPHNSPSWGRGIVTQVLALRTLDETDRILELLSTELETASLEFIPVLANMYADELSTSQGPEAAYYFLDGLERGGDEPSLLIEKSLYAEQSGMLDKAEVALRAFIRARPDSADGYNTLGYMFAVHNTNLEEALSLIEQALRIEPNSAAIIDSHAWVLYRLGDLDQARERLEESLRLMGNNPHVEVMSHYGEVLWELGERDFAVRIWRAAWEIDSEDKSLKDTLERYAQPLGEKL